MCAYRRCPASCHPASGSVGPSKRGISKISSHPPRRGILLIVEENGGPLAEDRIKAFQKACSKFGLPQVEIVVAKEGDSSPETGWSPGFQQQVLNASPDVDAIVSFAGTPSAGGTSMAPADFPFVLAVLPDTPYLRNLFQRKWIDTVILPAITVPDKVPTDSNRPDSWFPAFYRFETGQTFSGHSEVGPGNPIMEQKRTNPIPTTPR